MVKLIQKENRFKTENGETYIVVSSEALDLILNEHSELLEGFDRDEDMWASEEDIDDARDKLYNGVELTSLDIKQLQETSFSQSLDNIRERVEGESAEAEVNEDLVEAIAKEIQSMRDGFDDVFREAVKRVYRDNEERFLIKQIRKG